MNEWSIYIALYCVLLYTQSALNHVGGGGSLLNSHQCTASSWMMRRLPQDNGTVRSPHTRYRWRGERVIETIKCMRSPHTRYRWGGERVIEPIKCMRSPHTRYRWGGREIEPIKWMGIIRRPWLMRVSGGNMARTPGLHPYSLREVPWDF